MEQKQTSVVGHGPSGEADADDGAGNPSPRESEMLYGAEDGEALETPDPEAAAETAARRGFNGR